MATKLEERIRHEAQRKGLLVPLLENLFTAQVEIEAEEDIDFVGEMLRSQLRRAEDRRGKPVFSPSQLAECLRYVYLLKHHKQLQIPRLASVRIEPNFYFFNGNWLHLKWQFALYKLDQQTDDAVFKLIGVEIPILSKHQDHGGTVDALVLIYGEPFIIDFKGLNVRTFGEITRGFIPEQYAVQLADYMMLFNSARKSKIPKITRGLLIAENKGGPNPKLPIALHEHEVKISTYLPEVRRRLEELREHASKEEIPAPSCESTSTYQFQGCPFRKFCRQEVKEIEKAKRRAESDDAEGLSVASPSRNGHRRTRRNSKR